MAEPVRRPPPPVPPRPVSTDAGRSGKQVKTNMGIKIMQVPASDIFGAIGNVATSYINARYSQPRQQQPIYVDNPFIPNQLESLYDPGVAAKQDCPTPRYLTYDTRTGEYSVRRRRRRRKMLTASDVADLQIISTLPNSANVRAALATRIAKS